LPLYPHSLYPFPDRPRVSSSGLGDDPDDPPRLLLHLEATAEGCRWLLDRWAELRALLDRGLSWQSPDKLRAIRLLGRQPLDAADSQVVATIFQASHVLDPQTHHQSGVARGEAATVAEALHTLEALGPAALARLRDQPGSHPAAEPQPGPDPDRLRDESDDGEMDDHDEAENRIAWQRCGAAFTELLGELTRDEARAYRHRLEGRRVDQLRPKDPAEARATLLAIVEKATIRLEAKFEVHQAQAALEAAEAVDRLCFDESPEGERLRRFQLASQRALLRTVDSLLKLRRQEPPRQSESQSEPAEPPGTVATGDGLSTTIWCGPEGIHASLGSDFRFLPAGPDPPAGPPFATEPGHGAPILPNEPTVAVEDPPIALGDPTLPPKESITAIDAHEISPNEPDQAPGASLDSPPQESAIAPGVATAVGTDPAATPARAVSRDDCVPPAAQGQPQAGAGQRPRLDEPNLPGSLKGRGNPARGALSCCHDTAVPPADRRAAESPGLDPP
jgi:hypothetical protein